MGCVDAETPFADEGGRVAAAVVDAGGGEVTRLGDLHGGIVFEVAVVIVGGEVGVC